MQVIKMKNAKVIDGSISPIILKLNKFACMKLWLLQYLVRALDRKRL